MAGFDCRYDAHLPDARRLHEFSRSEGRIVLTRAQRIRTRLPDARVVFVQDNDPMNQIRQVVGELVISRDELRPLTRCLECNDELAAIFKEVLPGRVPDYVLLHQARYNICRRCNRIYWSGSHTQRMLTFLEQWFEAPQAG